MFDSNNASRTRRLGGVAVLTFAFGMAGVSMASSEVEARPTELRAETVETAYTPAPDLFLPSQLDQLQNLQLLPLLRPQAFPLPQTFPLPQQRLWQLPQLRLPQQLPWLQAPPPEPSHLGPLPSQAPGVHGAKAEFLLD